MKLPENEGALSSDDGAPKASPNPSADLSSLNNGRHSRTYSRRTVIKGATITGVAAGAAAWGLDPWLGNVFHQAGEYVFPSRPVNWPGVTQVLSVCKQCHSDCAITGSVFNGVLEKLDGSAYHPNNTQPHAPYDTPTEVAVTWPSQHALCPRGHAGRQTVYDPYRIVTPLKRNGPRGSGQWITISWEQLISEVVAGGRLFKDVPGEENRHVDGFSQLWDGGRARFRPISAANPDFGPETNGLVMFWGRAEAGQSNFIERFGAAFGTVNVMPHVAICDLNHHVATELSLDPSTAMLKPDIQNAQFIIWFGANITEANFPMQTLGRNVAEANVRGTLKYVIVDVRMGNANLFADQWVVVKPGGDGALAMGMIREIIEHGTYNAAYLQVPSAQAAASAGEPNFSNATWLVIEEPGHPRHGQFLRGSDIGQSGSAASEAVVWDPVSKQGVVASAVGQASLWPTGNLSTVPVSVGGIKCLTSFQELYISASRYSINEYAHLAGISPETIVSLAEEFTSHGRQAVADFYRGPVMHTNGVQAGRAIMTLNFLVGNIDWAGGYIAGGGAADFMGTKPGAPYNLSKWPGQPKGIPHGVKISREGSFYEKSDAYKAALAVGRSPFPAPRPWFPFGVGIWPEIFAGAYQGYPYKIKILFQHMANPAWSTPGVGGAPDEQLPWYKLVTDLDKVPLYIASDIVIAESSAYADYIVPDTTYLENWGVPPGYPTYPTKAQGVRRPVVEPLTNKTPEGHHMSMEQFLIDVAKAVGLPGFGQNAFLEGGSLNTREDFYLKQVANIAYDPDFLTVSPAGLVPSGPVPDANSKEMATVEDLRSSNPHALRSSEWSKVAYVLARGGRFEDFVTGYVPNRSTLTTLRAVVEAQLVDTGVEAWARQPGQATPAELRKVFYRQLDQLARAPQGNPWTAHRWGEKKLPCQVYNEVAAATHNALTGKTFLGVASYEPERLMDGKPVDEVDPPNSFPFIMSTHKQPFHSKSRTIADPWLLELMPEAFIEMSPVDADRLGVSEGDLVKVVSSTYPTGQVGRVRVMSGVRPGTITYADAFGHWQYGSGTWVVNGRRFEGDQLRNTPVHLVQLTRLDPSLSAGPGWTIACEDPIGGGVAYFGTRVRIVRV